MTGVSPDLTFVWRSRMVIGIVRVIPGELEGVMLNQTLLSLLCVMWMAAPVLGGSLGLEAAEILSSRNGTIAK